MTRTTKHAPGPWRLQVNRVKDYVSVFPIQVCIEESPLSDETIANAALIAAAPTMYADLCAVRDYLFELYDEGNAKAGEYAASLGITIEQAEGQHHE